MKMITPLLGAMSLASRHERAVCPSVATSVRSFTSTVTSYVAAQRTSTVTGAPRCTETVYAPASILTVPNVRTHTATATATTTSYSTSQFTQIVTDVETLLTAATSTTVLTNTQIDTFSMPVTVTATTVTTVSSTSTAPTPTQTVTETCEPAGGACTIENFVDVCCHDTSGGVGCYFATGDPESGVCFI